jgi:hypothetical protein
VLKKPQSLYTHFFMPTKQGRSKTKLTIGRSKQHAGERLLPHASFFFFVFILF